MLHSCEVRRGTSNTETGIDSDILLDRTVTMENLAAELAQYPHVQPGTIAYNGIDYFDPSATGAIHVLKEPDGKWYTSAGEVT